MASGDPQRV
jgi:hypothetical protein